MISWLCIDAVLTKLTALTKMKGWLELLRVWLEFLRVCEGLIKHSWLEFMNDCDCVWLS